jgi:hypothetical protein
MQYGGKAFKEMTVEALCYSSMAARRLLLLTKFWVNILEGTW